MIHMKIFAKIKVLPLCTACVHAMRRARHTSVIFIYITVKFTFCFCKEIQLLNLKAEDNLYAF